MRDKKNGGKDGIGIDREHVREEKPTEGKRSEGIHIYIYIYIYIISQTK